ncbi:hypothetical protein RZN38_21135 [Klebsiella pneumoniae]|nr:hypothetical protein [Klebsiella pneumoniae]EPB43860.1 hypothetical protein H242_2649 [Klebsiella pneumoniae UHKPC32]EPO10643.1 hypothetical protein H214_2502 [Klebsiella pneumoniae UHKPC77]EPO15436.1 hypothetical protein H215_2634 [Klebsiella pneumoniae UHKPC96]EPO93330.1 hypothetical protein J047_08798 [Klebsiella pneumoniae 160_1080]EPS11464.1 hypothetical protein UKKV901664_20590 [Klebsiella pneumoniae subsp. pneumoniae UKKV901664]
MAPSSSPRLRRGDGLGMLVSTHVFAATVVNAVVDRHGQLTGDS